GPYCPPHAQAKLPILPAVLPRLVLGQHGSPFRRRAEPPGLRSRNRAGGARASTTAVLTRRQSREEAGRVPRARAEATLPAVSAMLPGRVGGHMAAEARERSAVVAVVLLLTCVRHRRPPAAPLSQLHVSCRRRSRRSRARRDACGRAVSESARDRRHR